MIKNITYLISSVVFILTCLKIIQIRINNNRYKKLYKEIIKQLHKNWKRYMIYETITDRQLIQDNLTECYRLIQFKNTCKTKINIDYDELTEYCVLLCNISESKEQLISTKDEWSF